MTTTYKTIEQIAKYYPHYAALYVTADYEKSGHAPNSLHYTGHAVDFGSGLGTAAQNEALRKTGMTRYELMNDFAAWWYTHSASLSELIHTRPGDTGGWYVKNGIRVHHGYYGATTDREHINHVHVGILSAGAADHLLASVKSGSHPAPSNPGTLRLGATGGVVKTLQADLNRHGAKPLVSNDGDFGPKTLSAVKAFQKKNGLVDDGVVGPLTWDKLRV